jgi:hypothetical protein
MVRKQIYIPKRQQVLLQRLAKARGVSEAEIIRQAIDQQVMGAVRSTPGDPLALSAVVKFARARRRHGVKAAPYQWKREDAYEERVGRYGASANAA